MPVFMKHQLLFPYMVYIIYDNLNLRLKERKGEELSGGGSSSNSSSSSSSSVIVMITTELKAINAYKF
jgi:hypothetical protein